MRFRDAYDPFRALAGAVRLVRAAPATMIVGSILVAAVSPSWTWGIETRDERVFAVLACAGCVIGLALFVVSTVLRLGLATAVERVAVTGVERIADLWEPRGRFLSMVGAQILQAVLCVLALMPFALLALGAGVIGHGIGGDEAAVAIGALVLLVCSPAIVFLWLGLALVPQAVAFERRDPLDAVRRSWSLVRGNRLWLFWFCLVQIAVVLSGLCVCCVGVFGTAALAELAGFDAYLRLVRDDAQLWAIEGGAGAPLRSTGEAEPAGEPTEQAW